VLFQAKLMENWFAGGLSRDESYAKLSATTITGAFLVRFSRNRQKHIIDVRVPTKDEVKCVEVETQPVSHG
jgi:hypothetical protein